MPGKYFEEFEVGEKIHTGKRTITEPEMDAFVALTRFYEPNHTDREHARRLHFKDKLVPGTFTLGVLNGLELATGYFNGRFIALLEMVRVRFPAPIYPGDTIESEIEILEKAETKKQERGILTISHRAINQDGMVVAEWVRKALYQRKASEQRTK